MKYYPSFFMGKIYSFIILILTLLFFLIWHFTHAAWAFFMGIFFGILLIIWNLPFFTRPVKWIEVAEDKITVVFRRNPMSFSQSDFYKVRESKRGLRFYEFRKDGKYLRITPSLYFPLDGLAEEMERIFPG